MGLMSTWISLLPLVLGNQNLLPALIHPAHAHQQVLATLDTTQVLALMPSVLHFVKTEPTLLLTQPCLFISMQERKRYVPGLPAVFTVNNRTEINERLPQKTIGRVFFDQFVKVIDHSSHGSFEACKPLDYC